MRVHPWLVLASVLLLAATSEGAPPEPTTVDDTHRLSITASAPVAVHVYRQVDLTADDERITLDVVRDVFSTASIDVVLTMCGPGMCVTPSGEVLKIRIMRSASGDEQHSGVLGQALIDSRARAGVLASVFIDRVQRLARDLGIDDRILLGRAIAHELGHLLLGTSSHGSGLMREVWSQEELLGTRRGDWVLDPLDISAIRDRLTRRGQRDG